MGNLFKEGDYVKVSGLHLLEAKGIIKDIIIESSGLVKYKLSHENNLDKKFDNEFQYYEQDLTLIRPISASMSYEWKNGNGFNTNRIKSMYAYTKLNKALIYLSSICQWGDAKHGVGPVKVDVDYKAKQQAHFARMLAGEKYDQESGIDHRVAIAFNCLAELQVELADEDLNDLVTKDLSFFTKEYKND